MSDLMVRRQRQYLNSEQINKMGTLTLPKGGTFNTYR